jgi:hypothetical protein
MSQQMSAGAVDLTFKASGDLSSKQYYFVKLDADGKVEACGANGVSIGILQNAPDAEDKAARVRVLGTSKLVMNEAVDEGEAITSTGDGDGEVVDAADEYFGAIALEAATAQDDIIEVLITHAYSPASHA